MQPVSPLWRSAHQQYKTQVRELQFTARRLAPPPQLQMKPGASRLPGQAVPLLYDTQRHEKMFSLFVLCPVEALSPCEPHSGSKDVHPQASAPFHTWP